MKGESKESAVVRQLSEKIPHHLGETPFWEKEADEACLTIWVGEISHSPDQESRSLASRHGGEGEGGEKGDSFEGLEKEIGYKKKRGHSPCRLLSWKKEIGGCFKSGPREKKTKKNRGTRSVPEKKIGEKKLLPLGREG